MDIFLMSVKALLMFFGLLFLLIGIFFFLRSIPKYTNGSYSYITEQERVKRSAITGGAFILIVAGLIMIASGWISDKISLNSLFGVFMVVIFSLPLGLMAGIGTYIRLGTYTKNKDDVVFLDDDRRPKN